MYAAVTTFFCDIMKSSWYVAKCIATQNARRQALTNTQSHNETAKQSTANVCIDQLDGTRREIAVAPSNPGLFCSHATTCEQARDRKEFDR